MPILCAIVGATGVGKTKCSLALAKEFHAEIISMDSRQIYRGFRIGTAQPSAEALETVPHHLVDFLSPEERFSAGDFARMVKGLLEKNPEKRYLLVGGTGLYLQALTDGLAELPKVSADVRAECADFLEREGLNALYERVRSLDPEAARTILPQDKQRLLRALEISLQTGRKFSELGKERVGGIGRIKTFWLCRERDALYRRIDERVRQMIEFGWKEEVVNLYANIPTDAPAWQSLGYREMLELLEGRLGESQFIECVQKGSRHYAKRQITWFRHQVSAELVDLGEGSERALAKIRQNMDDVPGLNDKA